MTGVTGAIFWLILALIFFVVEGSTTQFVSLWFAVGAIVAIPFSALGASLFAQSVVFLLTAVAFLVVARPYVKARLQPRKQPTNADMVIGEIAVVTQGIDNVHQEGRVRVNNMLWTARTEDDRPRISEGEQVKILRIEGVKLIVAPLSAQAPSDTAS